MDSAAPPVVPPLGRQAAPPLLFPNRASLDLTRGRQIWLLLPPQAAGRSTSRASAGPHAKPPVSPLPRSYCCRATLTRSRPQPSLRLYLASAMLPCYLSTLATRCSSCCRVALGFYLPSTSPPELPSSRHRLAGCSPNRLSVAWGATAVGCNHSTVALALGANVTPPSTFGSATGPVTVLQPPSATACIAAHGAAPHALTPHRPL